MTETELELVREHRNIQEKYVYFLLAAVGACIALAITHTRDLPLRWSQLPLGAAIIVWAISFACGCMQQTRANIALLHNVHELQARGAFHRGGGQNPELARVASDLHEGFSKASKSAARYFTGQSWCFIIGALCYVAWHVYEMWLRIPHTNA